MKIIHLISGALGQGGAERFVFDLASAQAERGHDVTICCFRNYNPSTVFVSEKVKVRSLGKKKGFSPFFSFKITDYLKHEQPDVVNCHLPAVFLYLIFSLLFCKKIKFFYTIHSNPTQEEPRKWVRKMRRFFMNRCRLTFVAISNEIKERFEKLYDVYGVPLVYNGRKKLKSTPLFAKVEKEVCALKSNAATKVFVAVGRLTSEKNHSLMIKAFAEMQQENIVLLIIGSGDVHQFDVIKPANVHFLGAKDNVCDYLFCADAFCMSSVYEGLPISILEAMSVGLPILSTNVGGIPDVVKDGENGLLSPTLEVEDYVQMLKRYLSLSEEERKRMSENNTVAFSQKYDIEKTADEYLKLYNK